MMDVCPGLARTGEAMNKVSLGLAVWLVILGLFGAGGIALADGVPKGPEDDGTKPALTRIAGEGMMNSHAFEFLTELSDKVGARVTGTPEAQKAVVWGIAKMRGIGLENVHAEKWQLWRGWRRGSADGDIIAPTRSRLGAAGVGGAGGL